MQLRQHVSKLGTAIAGRGKLAAASVIAVGLAVGGMAAADAAGNPGIADGSVYHIDIADGAVGSDTIANRAIQSYDMNRALVNALLAVPANGVDSSKVKDGSLNERDLDAATQKKLNAVGTGEQGPKGDKGEKGDKGDPGDPASDAKGAVLVSQNFEPKAVENCGGSFKTRKTKLGEFELPAGKNLKIDSYLFGARTTTGKPGTVAQLALRVGATDSAFGDDYGTVFAPLPAHKDREITGSTFFVVDSNPKPATVEVFGFCYNDDDAGSSAGSNEWTAAARIAVTQG